MFSCSFGHVKAVSSVLFGRINGEKMIPYKKNLYYYNGLIILNLINIPKIAKINMIIYSQIRFTGN